MGKLIRTTAAISILALTFSAASNARAVELGGDARIRFERNETSGRTARDRLRFRLRYGFRAEVDEKTSVGVRLISGGAQQTSGNQTMGDSFSSKPIQIDRAYITHAPAPPYTITLGKMANPFTRTDMTWSSDVSPEGIAFSAKAGGKSMVLGYLPLQEFSGTTKDPHILALQAGASAGKAKATVSYYHFNHIEGNTVESISPAAARRTNTFREDQEGNMVFAYEYRIADLNLEYRSSFRGGAREIPFRVFGNYIINLESAVEEDTGYLAGFSIGRLNSRGDISLGYRYADVDADATAAFLNEDQLRTNRKQHKIGLNYALSESSSLNLTLYTGSEKDGSSSTDIWMANYAVKF